MVYRICKVAKYMYTLPSLLRTSHCWRPKEDLRKFVSSPDVVELDLGKPSMAATGVAEAGHDGGEDTHGQQECRAE